MDGVFRTTLPWWCVWSFAQTFYHIQHLVREQLWLYLPYGKLSSAPPPRDRVISVTVTKTGSGPIVVSAKTERKNGISVKNTNQLAGNRTFIILLTLISSQRKYPQPPLAGLLSVSSCALRRAFELYPLCAWHRQTQRCSMPQWWHIQTASLPRQTTAAMSKTAPGSQRSWGWNVEHFLMTNAEVWQRCWEIVYQKG